MTIRLIESLLPEGKENAISSDLLVQMLHLRSKRELQLLIAKERMDGALILSSSTGGYFTSKDPDEVAEFIRTLESRAKHTFIALRGARKFLHDNEKEAAESSGLQN